MSFNHAENRARSGAMRTYCQQAVDAEQREAVRRGVRDSATWRNIYYLAKFAGIFGLNVQDVGAQQRGMSVDDFKAMLEKSGAPTHG
jgi:protocatechuate 4,5-dioxygenase alpha chain